MAGVVIDVTISHGGSLLDEVQDSLNDDGYEWIVVHEAGACAPCRGNEDPDLVPFPGCHGNSALWAQKAADDDPDGDSDSDRKPRDVGNMCQCTRRLVKRGPDSEPLESEPV